MGGSDVAKVDVSSEMFRWALERSNLTASALEKRHPGIQKWLSKSVQPTLRQLEAFAKTTRTPLGYFFLKVPPVEVLPLPFFRTLEEDPHAQPSPELIDTVYTMQRRQSWLRDYMIDDNEEPLTFVGSCSVGDDPRIVAEKLRKTLGLKRNWASFYSNWSEAVRGLRNIMEHSGILVVINSVVGNNTHRKLDHREFRGFVLVDEFAPLVFVNGADFKVAQMFTLAHELAHIMFGKSALFDLQGLQPADDPLEQACDKVAAEFLVPENDLLATWPRVERDQNPFQSAARIFKVSEIVVARRALDLELITKAEFFRFYEYCVQDAKRRQSTKSDNGPSFWTLQNMRIGRRFGSYVVRAVNEGRLTYTSGYDLIGLHGVTFNKYAELLKSDGYL